MVVAWPPSPMVRPAPPARASQASSKPRSRSSRNRASMPRPSGFSHVAQAVGLGPGRAVCGQGEGWHERRVRADAFGEACRDAGPRRRAGGGCGLDWPMHRSGITMAAGTRRAPRGVMSGDMTVYPLLLATPTEGRRRRTRTWDVDKFSASPRGRRRREAVHGTPVRATGSTVCRQSAGNVDLWL